MRVEAVNTGLGLALLENGEIARIDAMYDADGQTDDGNAALTCVVQLPDSKWQVVDLRGFKAAPEH